MPRARNIKPSFFKNEILGEADPLLSLLFAGLWCLADREGRLEDRPKRIKAEIFPYRNGLDADAMLDFLANHSFINRYRIEDESFIQILKFHEHQRPHHMEVESVIPPMPGETNKLNAKPLYKRQKERILGRDGHRCVKCGSTKKLHIDHILPVFKGGTSDDENLQVLCEKCNTSNRSRIDHDSITNRSRIVETAPCPTDSLIPDSLNPDPLKENPPLDPPPPRGAPAKRKKPIPEDWTLTDHLIEWAKGKRPASTHEIEAEAEKFRVHHAARGTLMKDWDSAWMTWWLRAPDFAPRRAGGSESELDEYLRSAARRAKLEDDS